MLSKLVGHVSNRSAIIKASHYPASNTAAVITIAAVAGFQHFIHGVQWSYSAEPTGGRLTVTVNAVTVWDADVISGGPGGFSFEIPGGTNQAVVITLAAGGAGITGKLNCQHTTESSSSK